MERGEIGERKVHGKVEKGKTRDREGGNKIKRRVW